MWRVANGKIYAGINALDRSPKGEAGADVFGQLPYKTATKGTIEQSGTAYFIPEKSLPSYLQFDKKNQYEGLQLLAKIFPRRTGGAKNACSLHSRCFGASVVVEWSASNEPRRRLTIDKFVAELSRLPGVSSVHKKVVRKWDCCEECPTTSIEVTVDSVPQDCASWPDEPKNEKEW